MPRLYNKYGDYVAWPGLGTGLIVACYFGWRAAHGDFEGRERGAIIAGIIVGVALFLSMGSSGSSGTVTSSPSHRLTRQHLDGISSSNSSSRWGGYGPEYR
ncbi:hypothetical protein S7711_10433 [Stachybotrys chartarum IBT 7711]|uniref:Uncharacterized protein n=1 Tax=Stachybotrys chartarum (strain CBS 109288 / IBT 7711) TaxID=1280523 RepID=A0A084BBH9_STACB|nr:hypothetical protein S7711_10433 [Stachybotrys chartarum IBT 7711]KFA78631.1 hypothetical protein S40288_11204 [Stachybotrys chartarum IBT 40288]